MAARFADQNVRVEPDAKELIDDYWRRYQAKWKRSFPIGKVVHALALGCPRREFEDALAVVLAQSEGRDG